MLRVIIGRILAVVVIVAVVSLYMYIGAVRHDRDMYKAELKAVQHENEVLTQQLAVANDISSRLDRLAEQDRQLDRSLQNAAEQIRNAPGANDLVPSELAFAWYDSVISLRTQPSGSGVSVPNDSTRATELQPTNTATA